MIEKQRVPYHSSRREEIPYIRLAVICVDLHASGGDFSGACGGCVPRGGGDQLVTALGGVG